MHHERSRKGKIKEKICSFLPYLNEYQKRIYLALESISLGRGGNSFIEKETGVSHNTINKGLAEISSNAHHTGGSIRKSGGGRKKKITGEVWGLIKEFIEPHTR